MSAVIASLLANPQTLSILAGAIGGAIIFVLGKAVAKLKSAVLKTPTKVDDELLAAVEAILEAKGIAVEKASTTVAQG